MKAYYKGYKRQGVAKVHIVRDTPVKRYSSGWSRDFPQAWCGVSATSYENSPVVDVDPAKPLDAGLSWCGTCVGKAAAASGLVAEVLALLLQAGQSGPPQDHAEPRSPVPAMDSEGA